MADESHPAEIESAVKTAAPKMESKTQSLCCLSIGVKARVVAVDGTSAVARRLMEMGVVPGAPVCVIKHAPLGDPLQVRVRGFHLALRRAEAQAIKVVAQDNP